LSHVSPGQRLPQLAALIQAVGEASVSGAPWVGEARTGIADEAHAPAIPAPAIVAGDFNAQSDSREYAEMAGETHEKHGLLTRRDRFVDAWIAAGNDPAGGFTRVGTYDEPRGPWRIDYAFVTPDLAASIRRAWIDETAEGSDHL